MTINNVIQRLYANDDVMQHSLVEIGLGDGDEVRVHSGHDGDERGLSSQSREDTTELTRTGHIQQVLVLRERGEGGGGLFKYTVTSKRE